MAPLESWIPRRQRGRFARHRPESRSGPAGRANRPHDLELSVEQRPGTVAAKVTRVTRLGFEVRVDLEIDGTELWAQVTRGSSEQLGLTDGQTLYVRRTAPVRATAAVG